MSTTAVGTRPRHPGLIAIWFPIIAPLAAWAIHLVGESALVRSAQQHHWVVWVMHGLSAVLAAVAVAGIAVAYRLTRAADHLEEGSRAGTAEGREAFMGWLGLYAAAFNLTLILAEELIIVWVHVRA
jgi:hypothetical protein